MPAEWIPERLPEAPDAERTLLLTLLSPGSEQQAAVVAPSLSEEDFVVPAHRVVLAALKACLADGIEPSLPAIADAADRAGKAGLVSFRWLMDNLTGPDWVERPEQLVGLLQEKRRLRSLVKAGAQLVHRAADQDAESLELVRDIQQALAQVASTGVRHKVTTGMDILTRMAHGEPLRGAKADRGGWWGCPTLDNIVPIPSGEFAVLGGRPGEGKSSAMAQVLVASASKGMTPLGLTLELTKEKLEARVAAHCCGVPFSDLARGNYGTEAVLALGRYQEALRRIRYAAPPAGTPWPQLEALIRHEVATAGVDLVVLDQFDKIGRSDVGKGSTEAYAYGRVVEGIMAAVKDLGIGFVLLCQLKREGEGEPDLGSHADSDRPAKDAGLVLHLFGGEKKKLKVQKNRDGGWSGKVMDVEFDGALQRLRVVEKTTDETPAPTRSGRL